MVHPANVTAIVTVVLTGLVGTVARGDGPSTRRALADQAYSGVMVRDDPGGALLVAGVLPGPLAGDGYRSEQLDRGDTILSVNGQRVNAEGFQRIMNEATVGQTLRLRVKRTGSKEIEAMPRAVRDGPEEELQITLEPALKWSGPIAMSRATAWPTTRPFEPGETDRAIEDALDRHGLRGPRDRLLRLLSQTMQAHAGANARTCVAAAMLEPRSLPGVEAEIATSLKEAASGRGTLGPVLARLLDADDATALPTTLPTTRPTPTVAAVVAINAAFAEVAAAFARLDEREQVLLRTQLPRLLDVLSQRAELKGEGVADLLEAMRCTPRIDQRTLLAAADRLVRLVESDPGSPAGLADRLPAAIRDAVQGEIAGVALSDAGWVVFGGTGTNRYDMTRLAAVFDPGGDDVYGWSSLQKPRVQLVIDAGGNDRHVGHVAAALLGVCVVIDRSGDDVYESDRTLSIAAAAGGVAVLIDEAGNDRYTGTTWTCGGAIHGAACLIDRVGNDQYAAADTSQGIGGPGGVGVLIDLAGDDRYHADGQTPSAYGQKGEFYAMSQGIGLGLRGYDSGGIGVLIDQRGDDEYTAGEFSQGGGYFFGLGILRDEAGRDRYTGRRYAQGFGCHQAVGILVDAGGDDQYVARTAANQGAAWDISVGMLIDRSGNDSYRGGGIAQGSAAMQGFAVLLDLGGDDVYEAATPSQGRSGGNAYHFDATATRSFSVLLDAGGTDRFSSGQENGRTVCTDPTPPQDGADAPRHGLFIDLP